MIGKHTCSCPGCDVFLKFRQSLDIYKVLQHTLDPLPIPSSQPKSQIPEVVEKKETSSIYSSNAGWTKPQFAMDFITFVHFRGRTEWSLWPNELVSSPSHFYSHVCEELIVTFAVVDDVPVPKEGTDDEQKMI